MTREDIEVFLKEHGIRRTPFRIELLTMFDNAVHALSHNDITERLQSSQDRVTIYRALDAFVEKGIIHRVPDLQGSIAKYAMCSHDCNATEHNDNHVHFICNSCQHTYCLDDIIIPKIPLPSGFQRGQSDLTIRGICEKCSA